MGRPSSDRGADRPAGPARAGAGLTILKRLQFAAEALAARLAFRILRALPARRASDLGGWLARRIGPLLPVHRVGQANLAMALPELDAAARDAVLRAVWDNLGRTAAELPHIQACEWEVVGAAHLEVLRQGGPAILLSGHFGNWEVLPPALLRFGIRMASVYRAADNPTVDRFINRFRWRATQGAGLRLFPKGAAGARAALRHLAAGGVLGLLVDQKLNDGIAVPLLGHLAMTAPAPAQLALRFRCPVIPGRVERLGPCRFRIIVGPPLPLPEDADRAQAVAALTRSINDWLSGGIRARPQDWLWLHRRWPKDGSR